MSRIEFSPEVLRAATLIGCSPWELIKYDGMSVEDICSQWLRNNKMEQFGNVIAKRLEYMLSVMNEAHSLCQQIEKLQKDVSALMSKCDYMGRISDPFEQVYAECKKVKWGYKKMNSSEILLTVPSVKLGNQVEGYISIRDLQLQLDIDLLYCYSLTGIINGVRISNLRHPHISVAGGICYGSAKREFEFYKSINRYDLAFHQLYHAITNYSPDSPYHSISYIKSYYKYLWLKPKVVQGLKGQQLKHYLAKYGHRCRQCKELLNDSSQCIQITCEASVNYEGRCDECGTRLILLCWDDTKHTYIWECNNELCSRYQYNRKRNLAIMIYNTIVRKLSNINAHIYNDSDRLYAEVIGSKLTFTVKINPQDRTIEKTLYSNSTDYSIDNNAIIKDSKRYIVSGKRVYSILNELDKSIIKVYNSIKDKF